MVYNFCFDRLNLLVCNTFFKILLSHRFRRESSKQKLIKKTDSEPCSNEIFCLLQFATLGVELRVGRLF